MHSKTQATLASSCPKKEPSPEKVSLSLDLLIGGGTDSVTPPPGLETSSPKLTSQKLTSNKTIIKPPPGLELLGSDVETGTGSSEGDSASTHSETEAPPSGGLVLSEVSTLTSKAKSFTPMLSPEEVNMLMPDTTKTSTNRFANRTKLTSKANAYVPATAFIPMAATAMAMADTLKRSANAAAAQSYAAGFADAAAAAAQIIEASLHTTSTTSTSTSTYESEQYAAWDESWDGYDAYDGSTTYGDYRGWPEQAW